MNRKGVTQILNRISYMVSLGMLTRLESHIEKSRKVSGPRSLQCSHWGFICPVDTPDGENCGLVKNLSLLARVSINVDDSNVKKYLLGLGVVETGVFNIWEMDIVQNGWYLVILNGKIIGGIPEKFNLSQKLKKLRDQRKIHYTVSICCDAKEKIIDICTDGCRLMRPLLNLKNMLANRINLQNEIFKAILSVVSHLKNLQKMKSKKSPSLDIVNDTLSEKIFFLMRELLNTDDEVIIAKVLEFYLQKKNDNNNANLLSLLDPRLILRLKVLISDSLINNLLAKNIIEYLDVTEMNNCMISLDIRKIDSSTTHVEISYDSILGVIAGSTVPFPQHNQSPRNTYQCAMGKQSLGLIAYNMLNRMDTVLYRMIYPHKPIVSTDIAKLTNFEAFPAGINACIAVMSYSGYDIEDAVILNKSSIEKGFGRAVVSRKYSVDINKQYLSLGNLD